MPLTKYKFHEKLIVRTPVQSLARRERHWTEVINDPQFMEAVSISSNDLYQKLLRVLEEQETIHGNELQKLRKSVMKYWSRMCTRTTPFGLFAAVGVADWSKEGQNQLKLSDAKIKRRTRLDMSFLYQLAMHIEEDPEINCYLKFYPNSSIYMMGDDYRFLETENIGSRKDYKITAVSRTSHLNMILEQAEKGVTLIDLLDLLCTEYSISENDAYLYLSELVDSQILVSELEPTVTGAEYCEHIMSVLDRLSQIPTARVFYKVLSEIKMCFNAMDRQVWNAPEVYDMISGKLERVGMKPDRNRMIQVDSFADFKAAKVDQRIQQTLRNGIEALMKCQKPRENEDLNRFVQKFNERYEGQQVPLTEVLDPETGIGYSDNQTSDLSELGEGLSVTEKRSLNTSWDEFETWTFQKLLSAQNDNRLEIEITEDDLERFSGSQHDLAPSIAVMFRVVDTRKGDVLIESVGGSSAINLLGRFAHGSEEILEIMRDVAEKEETHNPEVIFAEIAHLPESRVGNILQRPSVRPYEIPYLAKASVENEFQVHIQDLYVKVEAGNIQLWSHKLGKRVIPRLSSAHNFKLSDLPVYRFLCDLQTHEKNSSLMFKWGSVKEQFTFYPRVRFQHAILSPACWKFGEDDLKTLRNAKDQISFRFHTALLREKWKLPRYVLFAEGDNELMIDMASQDSVEILLDLTKNKDHFMIKEVLGLESDQIIDSTNYGHSNQMLACLIREEQSYMTPVLNGKRPLKSREPVKRKFVPGTEWLYYKLYCGDRTSDALLEHGIAPAVRHLYEKKMIDKWFFIRYDDGHPHVRFRVHLTDKKQFSNAVELIASFIEPFENQKLVWRTELATYERETGRYGLQSIEESESFFSIDSNATLQILELENNSVDQELRWKYILKAMDDTLDAFGLNLERRFALAERCRDAFMDEFQVDKKMKRDLDLKYRKFQTEIKTLIESGDEESCEFSAISNLRNERIQSVAKELLRIRGEEDLDWLPGFLSSQIHMTINRVMTSRQRFYEMILYYFLTKYYKSKIARNSALKAVA